MLISFRFVVNPASNLLQECFYDPNIVVPWEIVEYVVVPIVFTASSTISCNRMLLSSQKYHNFDCGYSIDDIPVAESQMLGSGNTLSDNELNRNPITLNNYNVDIVSKNLNGNPFYLTYLSQDADKTLTDELLDGGIGNCPICLGEVVIPRMTRCGHIFWYVVRTYVTNMKKKMIITCLYVSYFTYH